MAQIKEGLAKSGSCYTADFQTNGKGQHGRIWESSKGQNLLCSYILELKTLDALKNWTPTDQIGFSAAIALGARAFFAAHRKPSKRSGMDLVCDRHWHEYQPNCFFISSSE